MVGFPKINRYYLYTKKTDMRKGVTGLSGLVLNEMKLSLRTGDGFVFFNKRKNMVKILVWDRTGFVIYYKQLSVGTFELEEDETEKLGREISMCKLMLIMEGVKLKSIEYRKRYCG